MKFVGPAATNSHALSAPPPDKPRSVPRRHRRRSPLERKARYLAARFAKAFGIALAFVVRALQYSNVRGFHTAWPSLPSFASADAGSKVPLQRSQFTVTDGDAIRLIGAAKGFNAQALSQGTRSRRISGIARSAPYGVGGFRKARTEDGPLFMSTRDRGHRSLQLWAKLRVAVRRWPRRRRRVDCGGAGRAVRLWLDKLPADSSRVIA